MIIVIIALSLSYIFDTVAWIKLKRWDLLKYLHLWPSLDRYDRSVFFYKTTFSFSSVFSFLSIISQTNSIAPPYFTNWDRTIGNEWNSTHSLSNTSMRSTVREFAIARIELVQLQASATRGLPLRGDTQASHAHTHTYIHTLTRTYMHAL